MSLKTGKWILTLILLTLLIGGAFISIIATESETLEVCPSGCEYRMIQPAIDAASPGDTIGIKRGVYRENLVIKKSLTLQGVGAKHTIIEGAKRGYPVIEVIKPQTTQTASVKIDKLTITKALGKECANLDKGVCPDGLLIEDLAWATITNSIISNNQHHGIVIGDLAWTTVTDSIISGNKDGIFFKELGTAAILRNKIINNQHYGVSLFQKPCYDTDTTFKGHVSGKANKIPGPEAKDGNGKGAVCPEGLKFLMTERGGKYP